MSVLRRLDVFHLPDLYETTAVGRSPGTVLNFLLSNLLLINKAILQNPSLQKFRSSVTSILAHTSWTLCVHLSLDNAGRGWSSVDDGYRRTTCFLGLDEWRWYSIPADASRLAPTDENALRLLAIDDGLVCELSASSHTDEEYKLVMVNPVAKTRRELPVSTSDGGRVICQLGDRYDPDIDALPVIVTVVDNADRSFKVFLMNRDPRGLQTIFFVYESSTDAWRGLGTTPEKLGVRVGELLGGILEESAVYFQGNLYAVFWYCTSEKKFLLSYNLEEDLWREVLEIDAKNPECSQLIVSGNRMFLAIWFIPRSIPTPRHSTIPLNSYVFGIIVILVDEKSSRLLVQIPNEDLNQISGGSLFDIAYGFPLNSNSVVLISRGTGRLLTYDLRSGAVGALPAHPLHSSEQAVLEFEEQDLFPHYRAKLTNLSLRNILSVR